MNNREIEEELESDDEYPSSYNESPTPPAYENDYRYDTIVFGWIDKMPKKSHTPTKMNQKHNKNPIQVVDQYDHRLDYIACGNTYKVPQRTSTQNKIDRDYNNRPSQPLYQNGRRIDHVVRNKVHKGSYTPKHKKLSYNESNNANLNNHTLKPVVYGRSNNIQRDSYKAKQVDLHYNMSPTVAAYELDNKFNPTVYKKPKNRRRKSHIKKEIDLEYINKRSVDNFDEYYIRDYAIYYDSENYLNPVQNKRDVSLLSWFENLFFKTYSQTMGVITQAVLLNIINVIEFEYCK